MNNYINKRIIYIVSIFIILQPIFDLLIGISIKTNKLVFVSSLLRFILLLFFIYYFIFINKSKQKYTISICLSMIFIFALLFLFNNNFSFEEGKHLLKVLYFPISFLILYSVFNDKNEIVKDKYIIKALLIYSFVIIVAALTKTAFNSYEVAKVGSSGYFYAANEIGAIMAILMPLVIMNIYNKFNIKNIMCLLVIIISIIILGTKTPIISLFICLIYYTFKNIKKINMKRLLLILMPIILIGIIILPKTPIYKNIIIHSNYLNISSPSDLYSINTLDHFVLGSRYKFLKDNTSIYLDSDFKDKLVGIGYTTNTKQAEMDFNDLYFRLGLVGFLIYFIPIIYFVSLNKIYNYKYLLPVLIILLVAGVGGHVLTAPAVSIYVALLLNKFIREEKNEG